MNIEEIKSRICDLRCSVEELAEESFSLWQESSNPHTMDVADYLHYELQTIASRLADLEDTEATEDFTPTEDEDGMTADELYDWWADLDTIDISEIACIPMPNYNDGGRGDNYWEFEERARKWWNSRTLQQKREIYDNYNESNDL